MKKAIFTADIHMSNSLPESIPTKNGRTDRLEEQTKLWKRIYKVVKREKADSLFVLGDLFDHSKVDAVTLTATVKAVVKCPVPIYILPGNHDANTIYGGRFTVEALGAMGNKNVKVIGNNDQPVEFENNTRIYSISFRSKNKTIEQIESIKKKMDSGKTNILLLHCSILGCDVNGWKCDDGIDPKVFENFDCVMAGHFHESQQFSKNGFYLGSPMQMNFGEIGDSCGVWSIDFSKKLKPKFTKIKSPRFHTIDFDAALSFGINDFLKEEKVKPGDYIRFLSESTHSEWIGKKIAVEETCDDLSKIGYKASFKHRPIQQNEERISFGLKFSLDKAIDDYVKFSKVDKLSKTKIKKLGKEILESVKKNV